MEIGDIKNLQYNAYRIKEKDIIKTLVEVSHGNHDDKILYLVDDEDFLYYRCFSDKGSFLGNSKNVIYPDDERYLFMSLYMPFSHDVVNTFKAWDKEWGCEFD